MLNIRRTSSEERKRLIEFFFALLISIILVALSRLEGNLFDLSKRLSEHQEFLTSVVYFGLININVVLVLLLSFLIFRNISKLLLERKSGVIGSHLRTKLVAALVFFALAPTALLFYISTLFLTESFETWFSSKVEATMHRTREAGALVYERDKRRLEGLARIALNKVKLRSSFAASSMHSIDGSDLKDFPQEYRVYSINVFNHRGVLLYGFTIDATNDEVSDRTLDIVRDSIDRFKSMPGLISKAIVDVDDGRDVVRGLSPILDPVSGKVLGLVMTEERFETQILKSIEGIINEFANLKPGAELIRMSYTILLVLMVLIIIFSATWLGFYVSKGIMAPIHKLAKATKEIALGNYEVHLVPKSNDEAGQLMTSFNSMAADLKSHKQRAQEFTRKLERTNDELDRRRKYMEVILRNISTGVISVDARGCVTSINTAAEKLLGIISESSIGRQDKEVFKGSLWGSFWHPIVERVRESSIFNGQIELVLESRTLTLLADGIQISDESGEDLGVVVVFDDASEQVKAQRVAAWREVARRIAHEIKNPITPIKLSAQRLHRKFGPKLDGRDLEILSSCTDTIISEVDSLRDLVNEFSKFARMPAVKTQLEDLNQVIRDVVGIYSLSYPTIKFIINVDSSPLWAWIDREQITRVFTNLINNSLDAVRNDGSLFFSTRILSSLKMIRVEFADNGCGIADPFKSKVVEPYFSTKKHGTGLGLAIVSQIISDHGGYVRIHDREGGGTVIVLEIPYNQDGHKI